MTILSKGCKPDNFEPHNSLKLSFRNIRGLRSNFVECESFLESNSPDILALCETNLDDSIDFGNFSVKGYLPLIRTDSIITHMHGSWRLCEGRTSFCTGLISGKLCGFLLMFLTSFTSLSYFFSLYGSPSSLLCRVFDSISSNINEVLSINPSPNLFVIGDFHDQDCLTYSDGIDRPVKLCYNFFYLK